MQTRAPGANLTTMSGFQAGWQTLPATEQRRGLERDNSVPKARPSQASHTFFRPPRKNTGERRGLDIGITLYPKPAPPRFPHLPATEQKHGRKEVCPKPAPPRLPTPSGHRAKTMPASHTREKRVEKQNKWPSPLEGGQSFWSNKLDSVDQISDMFRFLKWMTQCPKVNF